MSDMIKEKILIVEDEAIVAENLQTQGYEIATIVAY
jgi:hypothetical protein